MQKIKNTFTAPLLVLVVYVLLLSSRYLDLNSVRFKENIYLTLIIIQLLIFLLPGIFYCTLKGKKGKHLKLNPMSPGKIWFVFTCFGVLIFGSTLINTAMFHIFGGDAQYSLYNTFTPSGNSQLINVIYTVIAFAIVPAVTEEFIFRGIMLSEYSSYGVTTAIIMSSAMFSMLHFNLNQFLVYFFCGVVAAYAVYITQSLWAAILLHFVNNTYAIFFESILWDVIKSPNSLIFFLFVITTLFIVFLVLSFNGAETILYYAGIKGETSPDEATKKEGGSKLLFEALISPSFLACAVLFLITTLFFN